MRLEKVIDEIPDKPLDDPELLFHLYRTLDWSQREIAYELGVDKSQVLEGLIRFNILQPWTDGDVLTRALDDGNTPSDIADAWNCSEVTIRRWLDEHSLMGRAELTPKLLREMYQAQKLTTEEIANDLGYHPIEVQMKLREYNIERRDGSRRFQ